MKDDLNDREQPYRPSDRSKQYYAQLDNTKQEITKRKKLFTMTINAANDDGGKMSDRQFYIELVFKPAEPGLKLRRAETQLLLSYIGEILKEIEEEEKLIIEEEKAVKEKENA